MSLLDQKFKSAKALQMHMRDKSHCQMNKDFFDEYEPFYDFTALNEAKAKKYLEKYKNANPDLSQIFELVLKPKAGNNNTEEMHEGVEQGADANDAEKVIKIPKIVKTETGELRLPDGRIVGHKDYTRIYKQNLKSKKEEDALTQLIMDRAAKRRLIDMQTKMLVKVKGLNKAECSEVMLKAYSQHLNRMKINFEKGTKADTKRDRRDFMK